MVLVENCEECFYSGYNNKKGYFCSHNQEDRKIPENLYEEGFIPNWCPKEA